MDRKETKILFSILPGCILVPHCNLIGIGHMYSCIVTESMEVFMFQSIASLD